MLFSNDQFVVDFAFLAGDKAITGFNRELVDSNSIVKNLTKFSADYQPYVQRMIRDEDLRYLTLSAGYGSNVNTIDILKRLATNFLDWQGNCFEVKPDKLEQWLEFLSVIDGTWVIAQAYADLSKNYNVSHKDVISAIISNQCTHALINDGKNKKYADNHVHLGGHGSTGPSLISFALYGENILNTTWPKRPEYTLFESGLLDKALLPKICHLLGDTVVNLAFDNRQLSMSSACKATQLVDSIFNYQVPLNAQSTEVLLSEFEWGNNFQLKTQSGTTASQHYFLTANCKNTRADVKWLLFCLGTLSLEANNTTNIQAISQLIRVSNVLRNYMVVWGTGLSQFVTFFGFPARHKRSKANQGNKRDENLLANIDSNIYREFRIAPGLLFNRNDNLKDTGLKKLLINAFKHSLSENIHFVIHFSRSLTNKQSKDDKHQKDIRQHLKSQVIQLQTFNSSVTYSDTEIEGLVSTGGESLDLRKAIRGYDVAGNENDLPIEVFAPALRVIRSAKHATESAFSSRFDRPFLTVHAGEDYSHLLSGLRAIDEAVEFCDFKQGDRLGHALALGVIPEMWAKRQNTAYVCLGEHLDNLVWCYQKALKVIQQVPSLAGVLPLLQDKIHFWQAHLFEDDLCKSATSRDLYEAWKLR